MKIEFWKPTFSSALIKATVHKNGNLGFSQGAVQKLTLDETKYVKIGLNSADKKDDNLYIAHTNKDDPNSLKINKAGNYYYLNTKSFFNEKSIDYITKKIIFDIVELKSEDGIIYKFIPRKLERKKK